MSVIQRRAYADAAINFVAQKNMPSFIIDIAGKLGLTPGVVAGALAEEADAYHTSIGLKKIADRGQDILTLDLSHQELADDYRKVIDAGIMDDKSIPNSIKHPSMRDVGQGNIRVGVAITALEKYL